jgi:hypothetical protein
MRPFWLIEALRAIYVHEGSPWKIRLLTAVPNPPPGR